MTGLQNHKTVTVPSLSDVPRRLTAHEAAAAWVRQRWSGGVAQQRMSSELLRYWRNDRFDLLRVSRLDRPAGCPSWL